MFSDLRFAGRQLVKAPGFAVTIVVTLALTIAACTVMFSVVNDVFLKPGDFSDLDRMMRIQETATSPTNRGLPAPVFFALQAQMKSFEEFYAVQFARVRVTGGAEPAALVATKIAAGNTRPERIQPLTVLGRGFFRAEEYERGRDRVVVLGEGLWQRVFGGARDVVGREILINEEPHTIIGVCRWAREWNQGSELLLPRTFTAAERVDPALRLNGVAGWLRPGKTQHDAQAELDVISARLVREFPEVNRQLALTAIDGRAPLIADVRRPLWTLFAAVGCLLLLACANVANLLLVRATVRQREIALRAALGASRSRLMRQLLAESILFAVLGGAAGTLFAAWGLDAVRVLLPSDLLMIGRALSLDPTLLGFALALSLGTGIAFGLVPAWLASRLDLNTALKQSTRGGSEGGARGRWRNGFVGLQVACAVVLLAGAGLFVRSLQQLVAVDAGIVTDHATAVRFFLNEKKYPTQESRLAFFEKAMTRMRALPSVQSVGATLQLPLGLGPNAHPSFPFHLEGEPERPAAELPGAGGYVITPDLFRATGIRVLRGRAFDEHDNATSRQVVIINETLANRYFPGENPIGRRLRAAFPATIRTPYKEAWREIVGVVSDVRQLGLAQAAPPQFYQPMAQSTFVANTIIVRHAGETAAVGSLLKQQIYAVDKDQPIQDVVPLATLASDSVGKPRFFARLLGSFSFLAVLIAAVGIYGVMAYSVGQRTVEIGIRMALGARAADVRFDVLRRAAKIVGLGLAAGLVATLALGRLVEGLLFQTSPHDPVTLAAITAVLSAVAALACWLPARRATKIDPIVALRAE